MMKWTGLVALLYVACTTSAWAKDVGPDGFGKQNPDIVKREKRDNAAVAKRNSGDIDTYLRWHRDAAAQRSWGDTQDSATSNGLPITQL